ncbi:hypothetical protein FHS27_004946 [Rhodopirellula rubra]|uniref:Uncharacterized protein n=1 Tax=Aporhodopirellula rubra TaxID=980271 RepID=A0A7W5H8I1_9BACT|nr:hypothetical protein [Aporhodopirellula rubra]MBB3209110.1 hypothetical protein [Aporhodopirellula rubra]
MTAFRNTHMWFLIFLACCGTSSGQEADQQQIELSRFFPPGATEIEFLDVSMSDRGIELATKFATETDGAWLQEYVAKVAKPGQPLPYHSNFSLTEDEYEEFLTESMQRVVKPTGDKWECLIKIENNIVSFEPVGHSSPRISSIHFKIDSNEAKASGEYLGKGKWRANDGARSAIGPWRGYLWQKEVGEVSDIATGGDFQLCKLDILHLVGTDYAFMSHKFVERQGGEKPVSQEFMLRFKNPALSKLP